MATLPQRRHLHCVGDLLGCWREVACICFISTKNTLEKHTHTHFHLFAVCGMKGTKAKKSPKVFLEVPKAFFSSVISSEWSSRTLSFPSVLFESACVVCVVIILFCSFGSLVFESQVYYSLDSSTPGGADPLEKACGRKLTKIKTEVTVLLPAQHGQAQHLKTRRCSKHVRVQNQQLKGAQRSSKTRPGVSGLTDKEYRDSLLWGTSFYPQSFRCQATLRPERTSHCLHIPRILPLQCLLPNQHPWNILHAWSDFWTL